MEDINMTCAGCGKGFVFTKNDQQFYSERIDKKTGKAWTPPKRCKECREIEKVKRFGRGY